jgi:hypothetical protein
MIYTLQTEMNVEIAALPSIKDCFKFAVGYGLIDVTEITPPSINEAVLFEGGKVTQRRRVLGTGRPKKVVTYRYIPPICVVPMPDGADVDGPNKASGHFVLDVKQESDFRAMYAPIDTPDGPKVPLMGNVEDIIQDARNKRFDSRMQPIDILHRLSGIDLNTINQNDQRVPVVVPILRCYFNNHQVWIANGNTRIWESKDKYQSLSSDLVKWSAWPDGTSWFPMGITEASSGLSSGTNIWYNGLVDLAMYLLNPSRVVNTRMLEDQKEIPRGPRSDIKVIGDVNAAVGYLRNPEMPAQLFEVGSILQKFHGQTNAQVASVRDGQVGLVRGGTNALEGLLQSSTGRQWLASMVLKTGGFKSLVEKALIKKQLLVSEGGEQFITPEYDRSMSGWRFVKNNVTADDLRNIFRVRIDAPIERLNSAAAHAERAAFFDRAEKRPWMFKWTEMYEQLVEDAELIDRVMVPDDVIKEREDRMAEAEMKAKEAVQNQQAAQTAPPTQGMQAQAGIEEGQEGLEAEGAPLQ